jgi:hypothetical protein
MTDFELLSTVLYDEDLMNDKENIKYSPDSQPCGFYMFTHHRDRLLAAARDWLWTEVIELLDGEKGLSNLYNAAKNHIVNENETQLEAITSMSTQRRVSLINAKGIHVYIYISKKLITRLALLYHVRGPSI